MVILPHGLQPLSLTDFPESVPLPPGFRHCFLRSQESLLDFKARRGGGTSLKSFEILSIEYAKRLSFLYSEINHMFSSSCSKL